MALSHFRDGKTLDMVWDELGARFGYHQDIAYNIEFKGSEGASKMNELMDKLKKYVKSEKYTYNLVYVNDGSIDKTYEKIIEVKDKAIKEKKLKVVPFKNC